MKKKIIILGSTGSIGKSTVEIIQQQSIEKDKTAKKKSTYGT